MEHTSEVFLEIDTFAETIGADEHAEGGLPHVFDALLAHVVGVIACHDLNVELWKLLGEDREEMISDVFCGGDVSAKDNGVKAGFQPVFDDQGTRGQLAVVMDPTQFFKSFGKGSQLAFLMISPVALLDEISR